jgi:hypothetical protein
MRDPIPEADWKVFRELRVIALQRWCERVLGEVAGITGDGEKSWHERYLSVYRLIRDRDEALAAMFNNPRRSCANRQLISIQFHDLLTETEMTRFSDATRLRVDTSVKSLRESE